MLELGYGSHFTWRAPLHSTRQMLLHPPTFHLQRLSPAFPHSISLLRARGPSFEVCQPRFISHIASDVSRKTLPHTPPPRSEPPTYPLPLIPQSRSESSDPMVCNGLVSRLSFINILAPSSSYTSSRLIHKIPTSPDLVHFSPLSSQLQFRS